MASHDRPLVRLPRLKRRLFRHLEENHGRILPKDELLGLLYGDDPDDGSEDALRCHISQLRPHARARGYRIRSVFGVGYVMTAAMP